MAVRRVTSPDGREWEVRVIRVRFPGWPSSDSGDWDQPYASCADGWWGILLLPFTLVFSILLPLLQMLVELPVTIVRSLFSDARWIEAETRWPAEEMIRWRTTAARASGAREEIIAALGRGHEVLVEGAEREWAREPRGF